MLVSSNVLLFRSRGDLHPSDLLSIRRVDLLARDAPSPTGVGGDWLLRQRDITIDESVLRTQNLAVFL